MKQSELFMSFGTQFVDRRFKYPYNDAVYGSDNGQSFAEKFEHNEGIKLYVKLPDWFRIATPLGSYNPDWAVLVDIGGQEKLYFVLEARGNASFEALKPTESAKSSAGINISKLLAVALLLK